MSRSDFDRVYRREYVPLLRLAVVIIGDREVAEEVVHDAFTQAWKRWDALERPGGFLHRCVVNGSITAGRRRKPWPVLARRETESEPTEVLDDVLAQLPPAQRAVVVLRFWQDLPLAEIAAVLGRPLNTVKSDLRRALAALSEELER